MTRKTPRWLFILQWAIISFLTASTVVDGVTQGGWRMALNGFSLGFIISSMLLNPLFKNIMRRAHEVEADMKEAIALANIAARDFQNAINEGRIEVIPVQPDDITRH